MLVVYCAGFITDQTLQLATDAQHPERGSVRPTQQKSVVCSAHLLPFSLRTSKWICLSKSEAVAQLVERLPSICEMLGLTPNLPKLAVVAHACHTRSGRASVETFRSEVQGHHSKLVPTWDIGDLL